MGITRKQLKTFGATDYLVKQLTKPLQPIGKQGNAYEYETKQVLDSIYYLMDTARMRKTTRAILAQLKIEISSRVENTISDKRLLEAILLASEANARFEQTACQTKKIAQNFQTYKRKRGSDFSPRNNIVAFKN